MRLKIKNYEYIVTRSPLRIGFLGGGTDFADFYMKHGGFFVSSAIDRFIYCTVKKHSTSFNEKFRLNYSETELVNDVSSIQNEIIRESLFRYEEEGLQLERLYIGTIGDTRSNSGLGSSSAFACALDLALLNLNKSTKINSDVLAGRACELEIKRLAKQIGIQDQWTTATGGFNSFRISRTGAVDIQKIQLTTEQLAVFKKCMILIDTGISRNAESFTKSYSQPSRIQSSTLMQMQENAQVFAHELPLQKSAELPNFLAHHLSESWSLKRSLHPSVSNSQIDDLYQRLISLGCLGGKLLGAGGGGYLLMIVNPANLEKVTNSLSEQKLLFDNPGPTDSCTEVLVQC